MDNNLEQLKKNFNKIKDIRHKISAIFNTLEVHMKKLKETHSNFIKTNKEHIFIFGLDSLQFQSKIIDIEYDDMKRIFLAINNRIYCEYYKLYKIMVEYVKCNVNDKKALDLIKLNYNFPVYKDLEPYKNYDFEVVQEIYEQIILILYAINEHIESKEIELVDYKRQQEIGLNINNFVVTFKFGINAIREKSDLFIYYIDFFHGLHTKYLKRFAMKMNLFFSQITNDIRFEDAPTTSNVKKNEIIDEIKQEHIDGNLLSQLTNIVQGNNDSDDSLSINRELRVSDIDNDINEKNSSYSSLESLVNSKSSKVSLKDSVKNNFKKLINNLTGTKNKNQNQNILKNGPTNFTQMDNNRVKMNVTEKPLSFYIESKSKEILSPKKEEKTNVNLNVLVSNISEEDANELNETLNKIPIFEELNKECDALISPTNNNLNLIKKLKELENFENDMHENVDKTILTLEKENISVLLKNPVIKEEEGKEEEGKEDKDSVSNITMESFTHSTSIENIIEEPVSADDNLIDNNSNINSASSAKKKKKRNKKKK